MLEFLGWGVVGAAIYWYLSECVELIRLLRRDSPDAPAWTYLVIVFAWPVLRIRQEIQDRWQR
ncbi:MAG: hypothetical protein QF918_05960 [Pirellulaceae bacterium]|jgi:hypothetical protein|nr:hypothetical protein [Pirellulaceae bacterium]MDP6558422.1 hypothetical protein [Pirellulaceae bacterium]MDP6719413.1 hypothetical protein [Pirellulaceae bacterium]